MAEEKEKEKAPLQDLIDIITDISSFSDYRNAFKKQYCNLARRLKLLAPMFEELKESKDPILEDAVETLVSLKEALVKARDLLKFGCEGSKIYLVLDRELIMNELEEVTAQLEQALSGICYEKLDISDEVKEQVERHPESNVSYSLTVEGLTVVDI